MIGVSVNIIAKEIKKLETHNEIKSFLQGVLTSQEIEEIARRIAIVRMLKKGVSQHDIATKLGVGVATVTRGSKELQKGRFRSV